MTPVQVKSAPCIWKVPADPPSVGALFSIVKSVYVDPRVNVFPDKSTEPTVNEEFLLIVVLSVNFSAVLLLVMTSSRVKLPATSKVPAERLSKFAPVKVVPPLVCNLPVKTRFAVCKERVEFLLSTVPETEPPFLNNRVPPEGLRIPEIVADSLIVKSAPFIWRVEPLSKLNAFLIVRSAP